MQAVKRLYSYFQPTHYDLHLDLDRPGRTFSGTVIIKGKKMLDNEPIMLHAKDLTITSVQIGDAVTPFRSEKNDGIILDAALPKGTYTLTVIFNGIITDGMHGLYPCYYEHNGEKKELLTTQFESHHAREVFPCIDEPEAKATFDLTLTTERDIVVLSNMPLKTAHTRDGRLTSTFKTTPKMSSYLLAFVTGELHKKTAMTKSGVEVNVYGTLAQPAGKFDFGLDAAVRSIEFFDDYFGIPYPLPKADHVALPDFSSGAMENWGLITYREVCLLADKDSAQSAKEYVATVIAHETSHQWFGNLVTMKWWNDLWLNESFATVMEYIATDAMYPQWNMWNTYASQETISALRRDQLSGVQSVKVDVNHPDEISTLFDPSIVYAKGARLLKMLRSYIGEDAFRSGLSNYFENFAYSNTTGADLWRCLSESSGKDVGGFMDTWVNQPGFPVVSVESTPTGYRLTQERFVVGTPANGELWPISLNGPEEFPALLEGRSIEAPRTDLPFLNQGNDAHFISNYDKAATSKIMHALKTDKLSTIDRLALLHETSLLARTPRYETADLITLLEAYRDENAEPVWNIISHIIGDLRRFVEDDPREAELKNLVISIATPLYERLGTTPKDDEAEDDIKLRATILGLLSYADYQPVIDWALTTYRTVPFSSIDSELRGIIFVSTVKHGVQADFEKLLETHATTHDSELRDDAAAGLTSARHKTQITALLDQLSDSTAVKPQDVTRWYIYLLKNHHAREETWEWMVTHWQWIKETFGGDKSYDGFARYGASALNTKEWLKRYETFFTQFKEEPALARAIDIGLTEIRTRVEWIENDKPAVMKALEG